jgi:hypothetical protein
MALSGRKFQRRASARSNELITCSNCGAKKPENNSTAKNKTWMATKNDEIIKIRALRRTYAGLNWVRENKKYLEAIKFKTIFGYFSLDRH